MKKILLISNSFFPEISPRSYRTTELAKEFYRQGFQVTVITHVKSEHKDFLEQYPIEIKDLGERKWKGIPIKSGKILNLLGRIFAKLMVYFFEYPSLELTFLVRRALKGESGYDMVISIAAPHTIHWGVASIFHKDWNLAKTWVADCGDPYMGQENDSYKPPFYFKWIEKWFCRRANFIAVPTLNSIQGYYPEFHSKIKVIPQGFRFDEIATYKGAKEMSCPFFGYAGSFIKDRRDPKELLSYLETLDMPYEFHIYTHITHLHYVEPYIKNNKRVKLFTYIQREELLYELSKMDFVVNFENIGIKQTPSKLIDYAIINKPILSIKTGNLNTKVVLEFLDGEYKNGIQIENPDQFKIENVVRKFVELNN